MTGKSSYFITQSLKTCILWLITMIPHHQPTTPTYATDVNITIQKIRGEIWNIVTLLCIDNLTCYKNEPPFPNLTNQLKIFHVKMLQKHFSKCVQKRWNPRKVNSLQLNLLHPDNILIKWIKLKFSPSIVSRWLGSRRDSWVFNEKSSAHFAEDSARMTRCLFFMFPLNWAPEISK